MVERGDDFFFLPFLRRNANVATFRRMASVDRVKSVFEALFRELYSEVLTVLLSISKPVLFPITKTPSIFGLLYSSYSPYA